MSAASSPVPNPSNPTSLTRIPRLAGAPAGPTIYAAVRDAIIGAELEPGRQISENELAAQLGVSRTPVREALARLRDDRLVEIVPQLGTFVSRISVTGVNDAQFVREALECAAVRLSAERAGPGDVAVLNSIVARQEAARDAEDVDGFFRLDDEFHSALCGISGHGIAWDIAHRANGHLDRLRRLSLYQPHFIAEFVSEHKSVVDAVFLADADAAEDALRHHLRMVLSGLPAIRSEHPDYFDEA
jgi:DNA-binding GntR family transcriptional regulator